MYQQYPYFIRRSQRRNEGYYQQFPNYNEYDQQSFHYNTNSNVNGFNGQQVPYLYQQQTYQQNPQQQFVNNYNNGHLNGPMNTPFPTPYPKPMPYFKQQPSGFQNVLSQFKKNDGQFDFNKMMDTAGQMMSAVNQMGGLFKGVTSIFKP
ncbi:YppG family protein [Metabacillus litoralis]|uniref:YppG family protein n=1 Tax=Metabacillus litoralis TaxID=152268 RepID=UPI001CFC6977|nr:YppG family protein [Metabacillus litoralis]